MIFGVDPGEKGGVASFSEATGWLAKPLPVVSYRTGSNKERHEIDLPRLVETFETFRDLIGVVVLEEPVVIPVNHRLSIAVLFRNYGEIRGVLAAMHIPFLPVKPQTWKAAILKGTAKDKAAAIAYVRNMHPDLDIRNPNKPSTYLDGLADAVCLAEYGRRVRNGGEVSK